MNTDNTNDNTGNNAGKKKKKSAPPRPKVPKVSSAKKVAKRVAEGSYIIEKDKPGKSPKATQSMLWQPMDDDSADIPVTEKKSRRSKSPEARVLDDSDTSTKGPFASPKSSVVMENPEVKVTGTIKLPRGTHALKTIQKLAEKRQAESESSPTPAIDASDKRDNESTPPTQDSEESSSEQEK